MGSVTAIAVALLLLLVSGVCFAFLTADMPGRVRKGSISMESAGRNRKIEISMFVPEGESYQNDEARFDSRYAAFESPSETTVYRNSSLGYSGKAESVIAMQGDVHPPPGTLRDVIVPEPSREKGKKGKMIHCQQMGSVFVSVESPPSPPVATITILKEG